MPNIPAQADKNTATSILVKYGTENNFVLVCPCKKSSTYKNWRGTKSYERKRYRTNTRMECPYTIRLSRKEGEGFSVKTPKENEMCHNLPLDGANIFLFVWYYMGRHIHWTSGIITLRNLFNIRFPGIWCPVHNLFQHFRSRAVTQTYSLFIFH
ncbi:hypothetical protein BDB01DRAFT_835015 [Pilobolus umbonatus]|nr:hypothetical protein BDB01DRAFT_835015 [Pilobolus umbonatus]